MAAWCLNDGYSTQGRNLVAPLSRTTKGSIKAPYKTKLNAISTFFAFFHRSENCLQIFFDYQKVTNVDLS